MKHIIQLLLSFIYSVQLYIVILVFGLGLFPFALLSKSFAYVICRSVSRWAIFSLRILCGVKTEVRGTPPTGDVMVAAKHHSFFDVMVIFSAIPRARFILKRELLFTPALGQYALRINCIAVARNKRGSSINQLRQAIRNSKKNSGQLVIYPQGTRVAPGDYVPYKIGTAVVYEELSQPCVPVATNIGLFWPKRQILRKRGTAIVEFLPEIPAHLQKRDFMERLETTIETNSNRLMAEAGFVKEGLISPSQ